MLSNEELNALVAEVEAMPKNVIKPYKHSVFEHVAARLASKVIHNAEMLGEAIIHHIAAKGKVFLDKQLLREQIIVELPVPFDSMEAFAKKEARIRKEIGSYDSSKFLDVVSNMNKFCQEFSEYGNRNMMELSLPFDSAKHIAAYFFRLVFYWDLFRHLFYK
jgi:hypothetical protein